MYKEIHNLISNDLINYKKRAITRDTISFEELSVLHAYTGLWACDEIRNELALDLAKSIDNKLYERINMAIGYGVNINVYDDTLGLLKELRAVDELLHYEEVDNLGFARDAKNLRKIWRKKLREINKQLDKAYRNRIDYIKEYRRPRTGYVSKYTGEYHNGLWWVIKACIERPQMIKYGFTKEG